MFRFSRGISPLGGIALLLLCAVSMAKGPAYTDPDKTDADFPFVGEYVGTIKNNDGDVKVGAQVIALGGGKFRAVAYPGGLPGDGWKKEENPRQADGERQGDAVVFKADDASATLKDGVIKVVDGEGKPIAEFNKIGRSSPTLGAKPPQGAIVLFDGKNADPLEGGKVEEGLLLPGCTSKQKFGNHKVHIEFRLPYQPEDSGQARGNSGIYLQGRYEVQMLDSFGLEGKQNECGGLYSVKDPDVNMCLPPLAWQTYDIEYTAAKYDESGKLVARPRITVQHNGVTIHKDVELPADRGTTAAPVDPGKDPGPIYLQDHGNPVRYRNLWVVETK
jgi:3-keto-disaccharide hydrolase